MEGINGRKDNCAPTLCPTMVTVSAGAGQHTQAAGLFPKGLLLLIPHALDLLLAFFCCTEVALNLPA